MRAYFYATCSDVIGRDFCHKFFYFVFKVMLIRASNCGIVKKSAERSVPFAAVHVPLKQFIKQHIASLYKCGHLLRTERFLAHHRKVVNMLCDKLGIFVLTLCKLLNKRVVCI